MFLNNKKARRCELTNLLTLNLLHMKNRFVIATSMRFYLMLLSRSVAEVSCILNYRKFCDSWGIY